MINSKWLDINEAAAYLKISPKTLYNLKCYGKIKGYNSGGTKNGKLLFLLADLDSYVTGAI